jgi:hypothetical protein
VPLRDTLDTANLALILVLVVVGGAASLGRTAAAAAALVAAVAFDFFLVAPYLSMRIESADDIETALLLLVVGLLVGEIATRGRRARAHQSQSSHAIQRVRSITELVAHDAPVEEVARAVKRELIDLLGLWSCHLELPPFTWSLPRLTAGGVAELTEHHFADGAFTLPVDGVELRVDARGVEVARFILVGDPGRPISADDREVAVVLADQVGAAVAVKGAGNLRAVAEE